MRHNTETMINGIRYIGHAALAFGDYDGSSAVERSNVASVRAETDTVYLPRALDSGAWVVVREAVDRYGCPQRTWADFAPVALRYVATSPTAYGQVLDTDAFKAPRPPRRVLRPTRRPMPRSDRSYRRKAPAALEFRYAYGGVAVYLREGDPRLAALDSYPLLDEDAFSELEHEMFTEAWDRFGRDDVARELKAAVSDDLPAWVADVWADTIDAALAAAGPYDDGLDLDPCVEGGGSVYFGKVRNPAAWLARLTERVDATCAELRALPDTDMVGCNAPDDAPPDMSDEMEGDYSIPDTIPKHATYCEGGKVVYRPTMFQAGDLAAGFDGRITHLPTGLGAGRVQDMRTWGEPIPSPTVALERAAQNIREAFGDGPFAWGVVPQSVRP